MIQRIQTLFLLLVVVISTLLFFFPIESNLSDSGLTDHYKLLVYVFMQYSPGSAPVADYLITLPLLLANAFIIIASLFSILKYKNRLLQIRWVKIGAFINILLIFAIFFGYSRIIESRVPVTSVTGEFEAGAFIPLVTMVFLILAFRRIRHDENLVRSADRLR